MIATAPEFANSISISFGNLGIALGTALRGAAIARWGIYSAPGVMLAFDTSALAMMGIKALLEARQPVLVAPVPALLVD